MSQLAGDSGDTSLLPDGQSSASPRPRAASCPATANGAVRDVFTFDVATGERRLISGAPGGANGPSSSPVLSADGARVGVRLVGVEPRRRRHQRRCRHLPHRPRRRGDARERGVRRRRGRRAVVGPGPVGRRPVRGVRVRRVQPGARVTANGAPDVFVRDLQAGTTTLVSAARTGGPAMRRRAGRRSARPARSSRSRRRHRTSSPATATAWATCSCATSSSAARRG